LQRRPTLFTLIVLTTVTAYFWWFAREGLQAGFSFDDLMSIYRAERVGWSGHLADILGFFRFSSAYRPTGTLYYLGLFEAFGFNPWAFRLGFYLLLVVNIWLGYALAAKLTGSREAAALGIVLFAYHGRFNSFFTNTGFIYDLLCFTFFVGAFLYYVTAAKPRLWIWCTLFLLALNAKEMAVTLPILIAVWELLQPERRKRWWLYPTVGSIIVIAFIVGRLVLPAEGLAGIANYSPNFSLAGYLQRAHGFLKDIGYGTKWLTGTKMAIFWMIAAAAALLTRKPGLRMALIWMMVAVLPIAFIPQRPLASACIPMFGLTMLLGDLVWQGTWFLARRAPFVTMQRWGYASFTALLLLMTLVHRKHGHGWVGFEPEHNMIRHATAELRPWQSALADGARTLIIKSPFPEWIWDETFLAIDLARERGASRTGKPRIAVNSLVVYEQEHLHIYYPADYRITFDLILSHENGHMTECDSKPYANLTTAELGKIVCTHGKEIPAPPQASAEKK
jgi:Dolichyl-phosphate-mannose-protein mannosyltransferase